MSVEQIGQLRVSLCLGLSLSLALSAFRIKLEKLISLY